MKAYFNEARIVKLDVYDECKYRATPEVFERERTVVYSDVIAFEVVEGEEAEYIERHFEGNDDYHEYLVLYFKDGRTATYRNSYVDMFLR